MICYLCKTDKPVTDFSPSEYRCKVCNCNRSKARYDQDKERARERARLYRELHPETLEAQYRKRSIEGYSTQYYQANKDRLDKQQAEWRERNPEKIREYTRKTHQRRYNSINGRLNDRMHSAMGIALRGNKKGRKWESLAGFTVDQLKKHLQKQFAEGMSWDKLMNGEIHIDHKIPISAFNFERPEDVDFKRCWSLKNLQPMWAKANISKSNKLDGLFQPALLI